MRSAGDAREVLMELLLKDISIAFLGLFRDTWQRDR
jgi:hypothetical protein